MKKIKDEYSPYCPYCGQDPYEYVDVGVGMIPVAVTCCNAGILYFQYGKSPHTIHMLNNLTASAPNNAPVWKAVGQKQETPFLGVFV